MEYENPYERQKSVVIKSFQRMFFQRFGVRVEVDVKEPEFNIILSKDLDAELESIIEILNSLIPPDLSERYKSIFVRCRKRELVDLRMVFIKIAREKGLTYKEIGKKYCRFDHSSVIHALETVNDLLETDENFKNKYKSIVQKIQEKFEEDARITQPADQEQDHSQSASVITLYPGKYPTGGSGSLNGSRSSDMSESGLDQYRESATAKGFAVAL